MKKFANLLQLLVLEEKQQGTLGATVFLSVLIGIATGVAYAINGAGATIAAIAVAVFFAFILFCVRLSAYRHNQTILNWAATQDTKIVKFLGKEE
jgi:hypothetical protein